jgi:hypothetical protein
MEVSTSRSIIVRCGVFAVVSASSLPTFFTFMGRPVSAVQRQTTPPRLRLMWAVLSRQYLIATVLQAPAMSVSIRPV